MSRLLDSTVASVNGEAISLGSLIATLRMHDQAKFVEETIERQVALQAARAMGLELSREELQSWANAFRSKRRLLKAEDTNRWLKERGLNAEQWQSMMAADALLAKFKEVRFGPQAAQYFAENRLDFESALISRIHLSGEDLGRELVLQLREEDASFSDLAKLHSEDPKSKLQGGFIGRVVRKDLPAVVSSAVFGGKPGDILGPFKIGKAFQIVRVEALTPAKLTPEARDKAIEALYKEWLDETRPKVSIEIPIFDSADQAAVLA